MKFFLCFDYNQNLFKMENTKKFYEENKDILDKILYRTSGWCISVVLIYSVYLLLLLFQYIFQALKDFVFLKTDIPQIFSIFVLFYIILDIC